MRIAQFQAVLASSLCFCLPASAALFYEPFDYTPPGALSGRTNTYVTPNQTWAYVGPGTGASADPTVFEGNLSTPGMPDPIGNSAITNRTQAGVSRINFGSPTSSGRIYYSMMLRVNDIANLTNTTTGSFLAGFNVGSGGGTSVTTAGAGLMIHRDALLTDAYNLGVGVSVANPDRIFDVIPYSQGDTLFVVAAYEFNPGVDDDNAYLWINPSPLTFGAEVPPPPTVASLGLASPANASDTVGPLVSFFLRNNSVEPNQIQIDEVRVDPTWAGVTVPEPSAASLFLLALPLVSRCGRAGQTRRHQGTKAPSAH